MPARRRDPEVSRAFGRALKLARVEADLGRDDLSRRAGLLRADDVGRYERGEREPTVSVFMALARALEMSAQELLGATERELAKRRSAARPDA